LFISIRSAASCGHPLQVIVVPRGALTFLTGRLSVLIVLAVCIASSDRLRSCPIEIGATLKEAI
jgi:hypothetical protein